MLSFPDHPDQFFIRFPASVRPQFHFMCQPAPSYPCIPGKTLLFTRCANSNGFCRCFAFQIGKICCHHCIIRHFQFRKCLPVYSNGKTASTGISFSITVPNFLVKAQLFLQRLILFLQRLNFFLETSYYL